MAAQADPRGQQTYPTATGHNTDRLLPVVFLLVLAVICAIVAYSLTQSYRNQLRDAEETVGNLTLSLENFLNTHFSVADRVLKVAVDDYLQASREGGGDLRDFSESLGKFERLLPNTVGVRACNAQGDVIYGADLPQGRPLSVADRQFFAEARQSRTEDPIFGLPLKSRVTDSWVIPLVRPLRRADGSFGGVVYINTDVYALNAIFQEIQTGQHGTVALFDADRRIYIRLPQVRMDGDEAVVRFEAEETRKALAEGRREAVYKTVSSLDGWRRIVGFRRIGNYPLYVLVSLSEDEVLADWRKDVRNNAIFLVLFVIAGSVLYAALLRSWRERENAMVVLENKEGQLERTVTELSVSEERFRTLAEGLPEMSWIVDRQGRTRFLCSKWADFTGIGITDLMLAGGWFELVHADDAATVEAVWVDALATGCDYRVQCRICNQDGQWRTFDVHGLPQRDGDGKVVAWIGSHFDITERESTQQALAVAKDDAEAANRAKSLFLANMSHEIRTPLNAIIGLTHLLRRDNMQPRQADRLEKIDSAAGHLLSIINDILDISKIEAGKLQLELEDFHLSSVMDHVRSLLADQAAAKGLTFSADPDGVPSWLRGDAVRLRQALLNYAGNAIKFTEHGGIILRAILLDRNDEGVFVRFEVEDSGIGISPEVLPRLFSKFEQADIAISRIYGGTGLGLAITKRLAQMMGGDAGASSQLGKGSTFWLTARLQYGHGVMPANAAEKAVDARQLILERFRHSTLLLVEDNAINRELAMELLHGAGLAVEVAENGSEAVAMAQVRIYDVVLMDIQMPVMDGLQATRLIRALPAWQSIPILAMTANAFADDRSACKAAGMDDFIGKPVDPDMLYAMIYKWLVASKGNPDPAGAGRPGGAESLAQALRQEFQDARLLVVEDEQINQMVVRENLEFAGMQVDVAADGVEALALLGREDRPAYALVLMDLHMPRMDGLQTTRQIRRLHAGLDIPIIAMTASASDEDMEACITAGMNEAVDKPINPEQLYGVLQKWLRLRRTTE